MYPTPFELQIFSHVFVRCFKGLGEVFGRFGGGFGDVLGRFLEV